MAMNTIPSKAHVYSTYRSLFRAGLRAVQFSTPARYAVRDKLRAAFREAAPSFNQARINNTLQFLRAASIHLGTEHKIVRNLCLVHYWRQGPEKQRSVCRFPPT